MRQILLFGAGKSSTALIDYLLVNARAENWQLTVADANAEAIHEKIGTSPFGKAVALDILQDAERKFLVQAADIVISLLPPALHILVARDCLHFEKNLLTASYVDESIRDLKEEIEKKGLLFLCEMGLDPGIDHMSAKKIIDSIHAGGGKITSFYSHCGGLVAPESDDNPWHYKISWNPRNVVMAGKAGAIYKQDGEIRELDYEALFEQKRFVPVPGTDALCWYPNRDSLSYISKYGLEETDTFIRTTLRHPDFIYGWKNIIDLKLTDEAKLYLTDGKTLMQFFKEHMDLNGFGEWLEQKLHDQFDATKSLLTELVSLVKLEEEAAEKGIEPVEEFMMVDDNGDLQKVDIDHLKISAAATLADKMHDANLTLKQLFFLGMDDEKTTIDKGRCSAADVLQFALEKKLLLQPEDRDMVVMLHELEYTNGSGRKKTTSTFLLKGDNAVHTAMAKTVGLPLAVAAKLILNGTIQTKGLQIPVSKEIYEPVLQELRGAGIHFTEETVDLPS
ncbi:saccharopine dehydrogenase C-terminal domain-containing protein [Flavisolibacter nicotianae]|uniref:saccharopine dehydrogenase C-terminal domain-containing protein n=1 Tax=Flavisolibacter nicotianae TaxID=2364882 RepID=UPI000EB432FB|nr:saccharopine dehydrogenase C-terminal domain-containing protein [Flavisolibacter nicotianae]